MTAQSHKGSLRVNCDICPRDTKENMRIKSQETMRVTRGGRGEVSSALFGKLEKSALIWRKNALIVVTFR